MSATAPEAEAGSGGGATGARYAGAFSRIEWMLALRYLRARRKEGAISVIAGFSLVGIMLGVATLIIVMSVMNGFRAELVDRILGAQPHISVLPVYEGGLADYDALASRVATVEGVTRAAPILERQVMASADAGNTGALVRAMRLEDLRGLDAVANPEEARGSLDDYETGVALGDGLARKLKLDVGDEVTLISPRGLTTPFGTAPRVKNYRIAYVFRIGMSQYDNAFVFMPLEEAQIYFRSTDRVDSIEVMVTDPDKVELIGAGVAREAGSEAFLWNWKRANSGFLSALDVERNVMFLILALIILVAALNIISGLIMLVKDKGRDIGILRTMGLPRGAVLRVFFICGAAIGVVGTVLGVLLGVVFTENISEIQGAVETVLGTSVWDPEIRLLTRVPAVMHLSDVVMTTVLALGLSFLATWYPAWRAARLDPVEALRYE